MQIAHATDKKSIWIIQSGSGPFRNNKLSHSEYNKVACAEEATSKQYTVTEFLCPIIAILLQSFWEMSCK